MDKSLQYRRTDRAIVHAFMKLVQKKAFERLTIQDILEESLVSRNTFYAHYHDKYEIAEKLYQEFIDRFDQFRQETYTENGSELFSLDKELRIERLNASYSEFYKENNELISVLQRIHTENINLEHYLKEYFKKQYIDNPFNKNKTAPILKMEAEIYANIISAMTKVLESGVPNELSSELKSFNDYSSNALINATLFALGIRDPKYHDQAEKCLIDLQLQAMKDQENYKSVLYRQ